jgi:nitrogen regulatory protein P-II 1
MQLITAIVAPSRIDAVLRGLRRFGLFGWNLSRVYVIDRGPVTFVRLDLVAANVDAADVVRVIARTTEPVTPSVWVTPLDLMVRIRTGERGPAAVQ